MKRVLILLMAFFSLFSLLSCSSSESLPPDLLFEEIEKSYGSLPAGIVLDSRAREWEEKYLDAETVESLFGHEKTYKEAVESAYLYLAASLTSYEEIAVLECYTSDKARRMAGIFAERNRVLALLEEEQLEAQILCNGRTVVYCRLANTVRAKGAIRKLEN